MKEVRRWEGERPILMPSLESLAGLCATGSAAAKLQPGPRLLEFFSSATAIQKTATAFLFLKCLFIEAFY